MKLTEQRKKQILEMIENIHQEKWSKLEEDIKQAQTKQCDIPVVVLQSEQLVCECGRSEINKLSGICEICWNEKFPDEAN